MLFRLVRPVKRKGSRNRQFVRRIPSDVRSKATGLKLSIPVGDQTQSVTISPRAQSVRLLLRTDDPAEVKVRLAQVDAHLENVWRALRADAPVSLTHRQATALAGGLFRAWADGAAREWATAIVHTPGVGWQREPSTRVSSGEWEAILARWEKMGSFDQIGSADDPGVLEKPLGAIVDRLLLAKGIRRVDEPAREILLVAFWQAMRDAAKSRMRNAQGDYSPDPTSRRFPEWVAPQSADSLPPQSAKVPLLAGAKVSLKGLVEGWWLEAKASGRKQSTHDNYANTIAAFVSFLGHDDARRVTRDDVVRFKDLPHAQSVPASPMKWPFPWSAPPATTESDSLSQRNRSIHPSRPAL